MSSSIAIPAPRGVSGFEQSRKPTSSSSVSSYASHSSSPQTPGSSKASSPSQSSDNPESPAPAAAKPSQYVTPPLFFNNTSSWGLLLTVWSGTAFCQDECTVINIGDPDGPPQIGTSTPAPPHDGSFWSQISYLSSSQGFAWNPEIFLPSYVDCEYTPLENRREPVHEIRLSDEEVRNMLPQ
ncbi:hypothetical protein PG994_008716 [Apiospora phragmitis]|uniref:Uncharacterized protein n=1 Tax=Apiospora phragmitis TaxID=2905665 RepID=A0ABR1UHA7_9PEZI